MNIIKSKFIKISIVIVLLLSICITYYFEKLVLIFNDTDLLVEKILITAKITEFSIFALVINVSIILFIGLIEVYYKGWLNSSFYRIFFNRSKTTYGDLWCWILNVFKLYDLFVLIFSFGFFYVFASILFYNFGEHNFIDKISSVPLQLIILFIAYDFKHFLWHWFMHKNPFWEFHKYHHSAEEFNLITSTRSHFMEKGFLTIFDAFLFLLFGIPAEYYVIMASIREFYAVLSHSELNWQLGWIGKYILISPACHRIHHSKSSKHFDKNYGSFFIWWDIIFGTYLKNDEKITIGLDNSNFNKSNFWKDMINGISSFFESTTLIFTKK